MDAAKGYQSNASATARATVGYCTNPPIEDWRTSPDTRWRLCPRGTGRDRTGGDPAMSRKRVIRELVVGNWKRRIRGDLRGGGPMSTLREINGEASVCNDGCPLRPCPCGDDRCYTCDPDGVPQAVAALMQPDPDTVCVSRNDLAEVLWHAGPMPAHASEAAIRMWGSRGDDWRGSLTSCPDREATR